MLNENAKKWVEALESDKYKQTTKALCKNDAYCCLGIACIIAKENGVPLEIVKDNNSSMVLFNSEKLYLPKAVVQWLGLSNNIGGYNTGRCLASLNDNGMPFKEIAAVIRTEPEGLFVFPEDEEEGRLDV